MADPNSFPLFGLNPISVDKIGPVLDLQTATINGILKALTENLFSVNSLKGIKTFKGEVLRRTEIDLTKDNDPSVDAIKKLFSTLNGTKIVLFKVRIDGLDDFKEIPQSRDADAQSQKYIDYYKDFVYEPSGFFTDDIHVGDLVVCTFGNLSDFSEGKVLYKLGATSDGKATAPTATTGNPPDTKAPPSPPPPEEKPPSGPWVRENIGKFIISYPYPPVENTIPCLLIYGGLYQNGQKNSNKEDIFKIIPEDLKKKIVIAVCNYDDYSGFQGYEKLGSIIYNLGQRSRLSQAGVRYENIWVAGYSAGGSNALDSYLSDAENYTKGAKLGLIDSVMTQRIFDRIKRNKQIYQHIRCTYNPSQWIKADDYKMMQFALEVQKAKIFRTTQPHNKAVEDWINKFKNEILQVAS